jgi:two-component system sensor histidine kinase KdpD
MPHAEIVLSGALDVHGAEAARGSSPSHMTRLLEMARRLRGYAWGTLTVASCCALSLVLQRYLQLADLVMIQLLGVLVISMRFSIAVSVFTGALSMLAFDFCFIPPYWIIVPPDAQSALTFAVMTIVAGVVSGLQRQVKRQELTARQNEARTSALYALSRELSEASESLAILRIARRHLEGLFATQVVAIPAECEDALASGGTFSDTERELAVSAWSRNSLVLATHRAGLNAWQPLVGSHRSVGVLGLGCALALAKNPEQRLLLGACAQQIAAAVERALLASAVQRARIEAETEHLRTSLLSSVSHDLRTPLAAIVAAGTTLSNNYEAVDATSGKELLATIVEEAERLNALLHNLLSITRLEDGGIELNCTHEAVEDLVCTAVERFSTRLETHRVQLDVPADLPLVRVDASLVHQLFTNLLENALRYTPANSQIEIGARCTSANVLVRVADDGPGIPEAFREKVFERFQRGANASKLDGGVGLGLTICRAIVRAHGGRIAIRARAGGGTAVEFTLPIAEPMSGQEPSTAANRMAS